MRFSTFYILLSISSTIEEWFKWLNLLGSIYFFEMGEYSFAFLFHAYLVLLNARRERVFPLFFLHEILFFVHPFLIQVILSSLWVLQCWIIVDNLQCFLVYKIRLNGLRLLEFQVSLHLLLLHQVALLLIEPVELIMIELFHMLLIHWFPRFVLRCWGFDYRLGWTSIQWSLKVAFAVFGKLLAFLVNDWLKLKVLLIKVLVLFAQFFKVNVLLLVQLVEVLDVFYALAEVGSGLSQQVDFRGDGFEFFEIMLKARVIQLTDKLVGSQIT